MLQVTMKDGAPRWIAAAHVVHIGKGEPGMVSIYFDTSTMIMVRDNLEELAQKLHDMLMPS